MNFHVLCIGTLIISVGKIVLLKDLSNIATKLHSSKSRNDLDESIKWLKDKHGK